MYVSLDKTEIETLKIQKVLRTCKLKKLSILFPLQEAWCVVQSKSYETQNVQKRYFSLFHSFAASTQRFNIFLCIIIHFYPVIKKVPSCSYDDLLIYKRMEIPSIKRISCRGILQFANNKPPIFITYFPMINTLLL